MLIFSLYAALLKDSNKKLETVTKSLENQILRLNEFRYEYCNKKYSSTAGLTYHLKTCNDKDICKFKVIISFKMFIIYFELVDEYELIYVFLDLGEKGYFYNK